jgi:hypothetical protein
LRAAVTSATWKAMWLTLIASSPPDAMDLEDRLVLTGDGHPILLRCRR